MSKETNIWRNNRLVYFGILALVFIISYSYIFDAKLAMLGDNANYYTLGKALAEGEGYVNISNVNHSPNNHYPPGYPAIMSIILLFTNSIIVLKLLNGLFFLSALWLLYILFHRITNSLAFSLVINLIILLNAHLLWYSSIMMSEIPFMFFSTLSLLCFMKCDINKLSWKDPWLMISLISLIIAYYIRSLGIALLAGYLLYFLLQKQWKAMVSFFLFFAATALPWFIRGQRLGGGSYIKQLSMVNPYQPALGKASFLDFVERFFNNFLRYITREIPSALFPIKQPEYHTPWKGGELMVGLIVLGLIIYGIYSLPKYRWLIGGYILGTLAILMLWPDVWIGVRFIVPIIPLFVLGFFYGIYTLMIKLRRSLGNVRSSFQPYWLLIFAFFYVNPINSLHEQAKTPYSAAWKNYFEIAKWLNKNEQKDVVVSCGKPSLFYLYSNTYTMRYKFAQDPGELLQHLEKNKVDYVVIDQVYGNTLRYLLPAVRQYPERFEQVHHLRNPDTFLLKFKR